MPITLGSNTTSIRSQRLLAENDSRLSTVFERLSSGQRINRASDDAAGLAISDSLRTDARVLGQAIRNVNDGISLLSISEQALESLGEITGRIRELTIQSMNGIYSQSQIVALHKEAVALRNEYQRITEATEFNGRKLIDGSLSNLTIEAAGSTLSISIGNALEARAYSEQNVGDGTFAAGAGLSIERQGRSLATADFDNDGYEDIISVALNQVRINYSDGDGTFSGATNVATPSDGREVAVADFNGDGNIDVVFTNSSTPTTQVYFGNGDRTFSGPTTLTNGTMGHGNVEAADFNGDGNIDVLVNATGTEAYVYLGNGSGSFSSGITSTMGYGVTEMNDYNNDGILDIARTVNGGEISTHLGNGDGTFAAALTSNVSTYYYIGDGLTSGDFNNDGIIDLISASEATGYGVRVLMGNGDGTFTQQANFSSNSGYGPSAADLNGDGNLDVIVGRATSLSVYLGDGSGNFTESDTPTGFSNGTVATTSTGDFNGDGAIDIVGIANSGVAGSGRAFLANAVTAVVPQIRLDEVSLLNKTARVETLQKIEAVTTHLQSQRSQIGAFQSRLNVSVRNLQSQQTVEYSMQI